MSDLAKAPPPAGATDDQVQPVDVFGSTVAEILRGANQAEALEAFMAADLAFESYDGDVDADEPDPMQLRVRVPAQLFGALGDDGRRRIQSAIQDAASAVVEASVEGKYLRHVIISPSMSRDPGWRAKSQAFLKELAAETRRREGGEIPF